MPDLDIGELERLAKAAAKRAPGLWGSDIEKGEGSYGEGDEDRTGFMVPYMETEHGKRLFDAHYCDVAEIHEDYDLDDEGGASLYAWDEAARELFAFIAAVQPAVILAWAEQHRALIAEREALREALEPSGDTKAAYHGEFKFQVTQWREDDEGEDEKYLADFVVPWTTVKEIMAAIKARAALTQPRAAEGK